MSDFEPYKIIASKFIGKDNSDTFTYEITFNQSLGHTGRFTGIEDGLNKYVEDEIKEHEEEISQEAEEIRTRRNNVLP